MLKLSLSALKMWIHLGCSSEEQYHPQQVNIQIDLFFRGLPKALKTDNIEDTICYFTLIQHIQSVCQNQSFHLIEYLTATIYATIKEKITEEKIDIERIEVTVHKVNPPVPSLHGGVFCTYSG